MSTSLPFAYVHQVDYFTKGIDSSGPFYRVEYQIASYADADNFVNALLGKVTLVGPIGGIPTRVTPHQHPMSPNLWCMQAEVVQGLGKPALNPGGFPAYSGGALIRAEYRAPQFDFFPNPNQSFDPVTPITWATQTLDYSSEVYTVQNSKFLWQAGPDNGKPIGIPAKIEIPITTMVLTYERLPYIPMTVVRNLRFRVNTAVFLGAGIGLVLFRGASTVRQFNTDGTVCQKTALIFMERDPDFPWNSLPSRSTLQWFAVADGGGRKLFRTGDLSPLVQL